MAVLTGDPTADYQTLLRNFECAITWGVDPATLKKELGRTRQALCSEPQHCDELDGLENAATRKPDVELP